MAKVNKRSDGGDMGYVDATEIHIPGVTIQDGEPFGMVDGVLYPVIGVLRDGKGGYIPVLKGYVPVLSVPQMTDEQLKEQARKHPVQNKEVA